MISLYRGELHKVSDVPRQWTVPKSQIPLSVFRNALKKRNAALIKHLQSPAQITDVADLLVADGTTEPTVDGLEDLVRRGEPGNGGEKEVDTREDNGVSVLEGMAAGSKEQTERTEEDFENRQERKRKREEDPHEENEICIDRELEASLRGKPEVLASGSEPMIVDSGDQRVAMDCDGPVEMTVVDCDESMSDLVRVRVSDPGTSSGMDTKQDTELGLRDVSVGNNKELGNRRKNGELVHDESVPVSNFEGTKSAKHVPARTEENGRDARSAPEVRIIDERERKRKELEAKLEKLRGEKHRFVLRLKQVLNEEELKKRGSLASGFPASLPGTSAGPYDLAVMSSHRDKHGIGGLHTSTDLEDGELDYARTPSPPSRIASMHGSLSSQSSLGPTPLIGRQTPLSQHLSQSTSGRGVYYGPGLGIPPSPVAPGIAGGALSPGMGFMGNLPSPLGSHSFSHMALQHATPIHAQKVTSVAHGHGQFSPLPSTGGPVGAVTGVAGGPPGFSGYAMSPSVHSHHSHLSQSTSSSLPHVAGQQGISPSSLLTTPRGPPGYHDIRLSGGSTWIQR